MFLPSETVLEEVSSIIMAVWPAAIASSLTWCIRYDSFIELLVPSKIIYSFVLSVNPDCEERLEVAMSISEAVL